jgi:signal recognition particle subunit SRP54
MMNSMTKKELDCIEPLTETRILRISRGAGTNPKELLFLLGEHKKFVIEKMGKINLDDNMDNVRILIYLFNQLLVHT